MSPLCYEVKQTWIVSTGTNDHCQDTTATSAKITFIVGSNEAIKREKAHLARCTIYELVYSKTTLYHFQTRI